MRYFLENELARAEVDSFGGELKSFILKKNNREYLWYGNPVFWGRTSPVLFPFVGSMVGKKYVLKGKEYPMGQHGFARDMEHQLLLKSETEIWFELRDSEETFAKYPFHFCLNLGYRLEGARLSVLWKVSNPDGAEDLLFSIGAHPAFLCPVHGEKDKNGYLLKFEKKDSSGALVLVEEICHHGNTRDTGLAMMEEHLVLPLSDGKAEICPGFFDRCTYMIEGNQAQRVTLEDPDGNPVMAMDFETPLFAIWSPEGKDAPFLCIEPWFGRSDSTDFAGELGEREYIRSLKPQGVFEASYDMTFYEV